MRSRYSALDPNYFPGNYPFDNKIKISFKEYNNINIKQISCWPDALEKAANFLKKELKLSYIPQFNQGIIEKKFSLWRIEPLKWWAIDKEINFSEELGTTLEISHSFTCISISGECATLLLNRHLPIDLRSVSFSECSSASSAIHHVSIKLLKYSDNNYYLFIPRGFGLSIWEILLETAKQFGYEILER